MTTAPHTASEDIHEELAAFREFGAKTQRDAFSLDLPDGETSEVPVYLNEFWTARQRAAHSLHEISYRACFKPQLPRFFIERLTRHGDTVYDPFMGRGTTVLEAALLDRRPVGCDLNPLSPLLIRPRLHPPALRDVKERLAEIPFGANGQTPHDLRVFFHPQTLRHICALRAYFLVREEKRKLDVIDDWIRMVAINRLTGHSPGFFSVYTLPPNQATSVKAQRRINERRDQTPPLRHVSKIILRKTRSLLRDYVGPRRETLDGFGEPLLLVRSADDTPEIPSNSIHLVVTSPPFLDIVNYAGDNWLRGWFCGIDTKALDLAVFRSLDDWRAFMFKVFRELHRVLVPGGHIAFEVGEVRKGAVRLEETVVSVGCKAGLHPELIFINAQEFTKTANCWGVDNNTRGTNTNRIVLFRKQEE